MWKTRILALAMLALGIFLGVNVYRTEINQTHPFKLGLDLKGGSYLVYRADVSGVAPEQVSESMNSLRDVIERRINAFGIAEPNVQTESGTIGAQGEERLVIELPGVTDLDKAVEMIGQTPFLEFKVEADQKTQEAITQKIAGIQQNETLSKEKKEFFIREAEMERYVSTDLTGKYLEKSQLQFSQAGIQNGGGFASVPIIGLQFNKEGGELFEKMTSENVGKTIAIYLDGLLVSAPRVNTAISGGQAVIEGNFTLEEAKETVGRLNSGALPIPIELISTNTIGPSLGAGAIDAGVRAGIIGFILVALVLVLWYRLPGLIAVVALGIYSAMMLFLFKYIPVTLTSAGIAGFIISIGIAVDANILIFERMKEELLLGESLYNAIQNGFKRAWASIRDANISSIISAIILFWFGTALIKGFALTFGLGIIVSMFTAITVTRLMLLSFSKNNGKKVSALTRFLYTSGLNK